MPGGPTGDQQPAAGVNGRHGGYWRLMEPQPSEWRVPAPIRALMWWPLTAFVLAMFNPEVAPVTIAVAGAVLAVFGALVAALAGRSVAGSPEPAADRPASMARVGTEAGAQLQGRPA